MIKIEKSLPIIDKTKEGCKLMEQGNTKGPDNPNVILKKMILKLAHRVSSQNKRIDEALRAIKKLKQNVDIIETIVYAPVSPSDNTPIEDTPIHPIENNIEPEKPKNFNPAILNNAGNTCLNCIHKVWVYETTKSKSSLRCDNKTSRNFNKLMDNTDYCLAHSLTNYSNLFPNNTTLDDKKIYGYDFISKQEIEENV